MNTKEDWDELDIIAKAQLKPHDYDFFLGYKSDLKAGGIDWADAREALRDFICSMNELYLYDD